MNVFRQTLRLAWEIAFEDINKDSEIVCLAGLITNMVPTNVNGLLEPTTCLFYSSSNFVNHIIQIISV